MTACRWRAHRHFNPRPRGEGDDVRHQTPCHLPYFNPRPRGEGDQERNGGNDYVEDFNPRPRGEGDGMQPSEECVTRYFNPRPRGEGDLARTQVLKHCFTFQSTPSRGGRLDNTAVPQIGWCGFQSTPSRGGRQHITRARQTDTDFNPRPRGEGDRRKSTQMGL